MRTFFKHRKKGKRWLRYTYYPESGKILAFHIEKRNDSSCKALMKKSAIYRRFATAIDSYRTDDWKSYRETLSKIISQKKNALLPKLKLLILNDEI
jgi:IS1 family transposase